MENIRSAYIDLKYFDYKRIPTDKTPPLPTHPNQ